MAKPLSIAALTCAVLLHVVQAKESNVTRSIQGSGPNTAIVYLPLTDYVEVTIDDNLLTTRYLFENRMNPKPCAITIDPFEDLILGRILALGFLQQIVVWGVRSVDLADEIKHTRYTMILVNPRKCSYRPLVLPFDDVPMDHPTLPPRVMVVPGGKIFGSELYLFYQSLHRCAPCQYAPKSLKITDVETQLGPPSMEPSQTMHIQPFLENDNQVLNGFVLAYNYDIGTTRVEYLNKDFTVAKTTYLNHAVDATSIVLTGAHRQSAVVCWKEGVDKITCERLDSRLYSTIRYRVRGYSIFSLFDNWGNAFITTASKSGEVILHIFDVFGNLVDKLDVGTVGKTAELVDIRAYFDNYESRAYEYCLSVIEVPKVDRTDVKYFVKCINIRDYTEKP